jgi:hypothetical protein
MYNQKKIKLNMGKVKKIKVNCINIMMIYIKELNKKKIKKKKKLPNGNRKGNLDHHLMRLCSF